MCDGQRFYQGNGVKVGRHSVRSARWTRFSQAPKEFHPSDVLPSCRSVIVMGRKFNRSLMNAASTSPYSMSRNDMAHVLDHMATSLAEKIATLASMPYQSARLAPFKYDATTDRFQGTISLKHVAVFCGLGKLGKNTLLINHKYGNLLWLCAVLASTELNCAIASYEGCLKGCGSAWTVARPNGIVQLACHSMPLVPNTAGNEYPLFYVQKGLRGGRE